MILTHRPFQTLAFMWLVAAVPLFARTPNSMIEDGRQLYMSVADNLLKSAVEMPALDYQFRAASTSLSFANLVRKASADQEDVCSAIVGDRTQPDPVYSGEKPALTNMLRNSIHHCEAAFSSLNDFTASETVTFGGKQYSKLGLLMMNANHCSEIYGTMAVYLRLKSLVPPSEQAKLMPISENQWPKRNGAK